MEKMYISNLTKSFLFYLENVGINIGWREALETLPTVYVLYVYMYISVHTHTNTLHRPIHIYIIDCSSDDSGGNRWFSKDIFFLSLFLLESILSHFN